jgi:hypothetical protein
MNKQEIFYLNENRYKEAKRLHLKLSESIKKSLENKSKNNDEIIISDFGCAAGEFQYTLCREFPGAKIEGYELLDILVEKAISMVPEAHFKQGSVTDKRTCLSNHSDFTTLVGVLSIFDSFENIFENLIYWTKNEGEIFVHSLFNNFEVDVNIKYNLSNEYPLPILESGWNIFSKKTISNYLINHPEIASFQFHDFDIDVDLIRQEDQLRSWTFKDENGNRIVTNGLCILQPHSILHIIKK